MRKLILVPVYGIALSLGFIFSIPATAGGGAQETKPASSASEKPPDQGQDADEEAVLIGAGDIANCNLVGGAGAKATAALLDRYPTATVFTAGDHAYETGSAEQFKNCYDVTWGRHKARTRPSPGNHDYLTAKGRPYFEYFGELAGPEGLGYYSYNLAKWHIVSLNSSVSARAGSPQERWLRQDLERNPTKCTLAYWHIPVFSSGPHGDAPQMKEIWRVLYEFGADVVINGHDHHYERYALMTPDGKPDPEHGIREFIVGTGGGGVYEFGKIRQNSEVHDNSNYGLIKLKLKPESYDWEFVPIPSKSTFRDSGSAPCVDPATPRREQNLPSLPERQHRSEPVDRTNGR